MQLQPVASSVLPSQPFESTAAKDPAFFFNGSGRGALQSASRNSAQISANLEVEYLIDDKMSLQYTSKDGDTVTLSMESVQYQKAVLSVDASGNPDDMQRIVDYIMKQYKDMKDQIIKDFLKIQGGTVDGANPADSTDGLAIPEYWNAENTSQRIVDFATQFFAGFKGAGEDFLKIIKDAIEKGFNQAKEMLGELPDAVSRLVSDTYDLVMKKLDQWAQDNGISTGGSEEDATAPQHADAPLMEAVAA